MLNRIVLNGRLTRDPEGRTTPNGKAVVEFSLAVDRRFKQEGGPTADFFRVKAWGPTATFVTTYVGKGRLISVDGRLETRKYTDKEGNTREVVEIIADNIEPLESGKDRAEATPTATAPTPEIEEYDPFAD